MILRGKLPTRNVKENQPFEIWNLFNKIQNLTSKQFLLYSSSDFSLGLTMWAPRCHVLEQVKHQNEKHMVWMSKCHWDDCSWFLSVVYGMLKKKIPRWFPLSYLENEVMGVMPVFARTWKEAKFDGNAVFPRVSLPTQTTGPNSPWGETPSNKIHSI